MSFEAWINDIESNNWKVHGVEVYKDGALINSWGDTTTTLFDIYSATKSILSIAVGIACDRGLFDIDRFVLDYLPEDRVNKMTLQHRKAYSELTIKRLLTMSVGDMPFRPDGQPSYLDYSLNIDITDPSKTVFHYNNLCPYLVGVALTSVVGDLGEFIVDNILTPLGITNYEYQRCPDGYFYSASKMKLTVHDMSKIALLMAQGGIYNGQRIVSEEYVRESTSVQNPIYLDGYGYYFWKYRDGFCISGKWEQKCYIVPSKNIVITYLADIRDKSQDLRLSMEKNLLD